MIPPLSLTEIYSATYSLSVLFNFLGEIFVILDCMSIVDSSGLTDSFLD
jgi:hypothetical protein